LTPIEAARLGRELEPHHLFWLEDAVTGELQEGLRSVRHHTVTPLAIGEVFNSVYDCTTLITEQLIDYLRMPLSMAGHHPSAKGRSICRHLSCSNGLSRGHGPVASDPGCRHSF